MVELERMCFPQPAVSGNRSVLGSNKTAVDLEPSQYIAKYPALFNIDTWVRFFNVAFQVEYYIGIMSNRKEHDLEPPPVKDALNHIR